MLKRTILAVVVFNIAAVFAADNIPALKEVNLRPRLGRENVTMRVGGDVIRPADFTVRHSLNGKWKFKGLDRQDAPFGPVLDFERKLLSTNTNDKAWQEIDVPLNWWEDGRFSYAKTFNPKEVYFRGYYRRNLVVQDPCDGKRRFIRFEEIGAEAEIFVNGMLTGWHSGDFVPCEIEIGKFLRPGDNLVGVRVLADFGPPWKEGQRIFTRPYGANWTHTAVRGGIWHDVALLEAPPVRISEALIDPAEDFASIRVRGTIDSAGEEGMFELMATLVEDVPGAPPGEPSARKRIRLTKGMNAFDMTVPANGAKSWSPDDPNLYWAVFAVTDASGRPVSARLERFGFRTMRIGGSHFLLNGKPIYLVGDSLHSLRYGGRRNEPVAEKIRECIEAYKADGANTLRTAHMPAVPEVYECADEMGMFIYDEWANSFCNRIDEKEFERNNLPALEKFVRRDYNHASVVLWSLGNEVAHRDPEVARQLDGQYDLVKRLDGQKRPACAFSGVASVWNYGADRLKTDFLDLHSYAGIDGTCWTEWFRYMKNRYAEIVAVYGENGALTMPLVLWECVGAGWCIKHDDAMKPGDVARYLDWMRRWCHWGEAEGIPFSASAGLLPILDRSRGRYYVQGYLSARLCELFRQDRRLAGFAPWFADPHVPGFTRWTQPVYPLLRNNASDDGCLMFRQLFSSGGKDLECVVVNDTDRVLENVSMAVSLRTGEREIPLGGCSFSRVGVFDEGVRPFRLSVPAGLSGDGEVCLRLTGPGCEESLNSYKVRLHSVDEALAKAANAHAVVLVGDSSRMADILGRMSIPSRTIVDGDPWPEVGCVIVPPGAAYCGAAARSFVDGGGTLLLLEPAETLLPGFTPLYLAPGTNHLVEPVVPEHPAFAGLSAADFDTWAENPAGAPVTRMICPLGEGVLACRPRYICGLNQHGMGLCEYVVGKGRLIVSSLDAVRLWGENPAATRYLRNILAYVAEGRLVSDAPMLDDIVSRPVPQNLSANPLVLLSREDKPLRLSFAGVSVRKADAPYKIFFFKDKLARLKTGNFRYLTLVFRSSRPDGMFDVTIPKEDHCNRLTFTVPTALSRGEAVAVRLDLKKDFRFAHGEPSAVFGLDSARGEIIFYNGYEQENLPPFPRPPVEVEIMEMRFE
jgi:beta-galactosidase